MSDTPPERSSNSKSNLIEVQHVGVTAKLQSPLKDLMQNYSSSTETENNQILYRGSQNSNTKYNKFLNEKANDTDTTITDNSKILYEMKSVPGQGNKSNPNLTPSKIEFQLHTKRNKRLQKKYKCSKNINQRNKKSQRRLFEANNESKSSFKGTSLYQRLRFSLDKMKTSKVAQQQQQAEVDTILNDLPEPEVIHQNSASPKDIRIGIYPFDHGNAEYLKTHDCPPQILSLILAERATHYATRFWAEFFGSIQIGVAFIVTFLLQSYRFALYSIINTLLVGFLHMTSDYFLKPLLTVLFNGFIQPPLIFCFNILSSIRDILEPIADTINNFMKPIATVGRSLRLVHATYNKKNITKNV